MPRSLLISRSSTIPRAALPLHDLYNDFLIVVSHAIAWFFVGIHVIWSRSLDGTEWISEPQQQQGYWCWRFDLGKNHGIYLGRSVGVVVGVIGYGDM